MPLRAQPERYCDRDDHVRRMHRHGLTSDCHVDVTYRQQSAGRLDADSRSVSAGRFAADRGRT